MWAAGEMSSVRHKGLEQGDWLVHGELKAVSIITHEASPEMGTESLRVPAIQGGWIMLSKCSHLVPPAEEPVTTRDKQTENMP